ncbi:MAG: ATP-binding protein, partial [Candidatus Methanosuratincola petrocarbonis]
MGIPDANLLNEKLFNFFMPDKEYFNDSKVEYEKGKIVFNSIAIYGLQGSGKTTLANAIVGKFIEKYGVNEVNAYVWD